MEIGVPLRNEECLVGILDDIESLLCGGPPNRSLALLGFREAVVMLRRGSMGSIEDLRRCSAVDDDRIGKLCNGGMPWAVFAAMKLLRPFFTPTSFALNGTKLPPDGKIGEVISVSADLIPNLASSKMELLQVSRLIEDNLMVESFLA